MTAITNFTEVMMREAAPCMDAISLHYYTCPAPGSIRAPRLGFGEDQWAIDPRPLALRIEEYISRQSAVMDRYDPQRRVALYRR